MPDWKKLAVKPKANDYAHVGFPGCWSEGEMCGYAKCMVDVVIPIYKKILAARDAHIKDDYDEVWHQLYSIASPSFDKTKPWEEMESLME